MEWVNDLIHHAMENAAGAFGGDDGVFNLSGLSLELNRLAGLEGGMNGRLVRVLLVGRSDVTPLSGGAHFKLLWKSE